MGKPDGEGFGEGAMPTRRMVFVAISVVTVLLMYLVPFFVLDGTVGPQTLIFWTLTALAYLIITSIMMRGDG